MVTALSSPKVMLLAAIALFACTTIAIEKHKNTELEVQNSAMALEHVNDSAAAAQTVVVSETNATLRAALSATGDSLRMFQRAIVQVPQRSDAVDKALGMTRLALDSATLRLDSLQRVVASRSPVTEDLTDHVRRASFDVRQPPYTVSAAVELPPAPDTAHLDIRIRLDSIPVTARLSCAPANEHGIRSAAIEATAPRWAAVRFDNVQQSADLCASPALTHATGRSFIRFTPIVAGVGRIIQPDGTSRWGGFVGTGLAFGS